MCWVEQGKTLPLLGEGLQSLHMHAQGHVIQRIGAVSAYLGAGVSYKLCWDIYLIRRGPTCRLKGKKKVQVVKYISCSNVTSGKGPIRTCFCELAP